MKRIFFFVIWVFFLLPSEAQLTMCSVFSDNMVLQQDTIVKLWGRGEVGGFVEIRTSWMEKSLKVKVDEDGKWSAMLKTLSADFKSHSVCLTQNGDSLCFSDIVFGEVWLCSGQSNMEMRMKGDYLSPVLGGPDAILNSNNTFLRICTIAKRTSGIELENCSAKWNKATSAVVANTSATAYYFGRQLQSTLGVPVGLIISSWGGANIIAFMSRGAVADFPQYVIPGIKEEKINVHKPIGIYNAMINPIVGYTMKGLIWYQGETNRKEPVLYRGLFKRMVEDWRAKWNTGNFPVYYAQIAPFLYNDGNSAYFREAQLQCEQEIDNSGMVCLLDVGERDNIHPMDKETVGRRFAQIALSRTYNVEGIYSYCPTLDSVKIQNSKILILFKNAENGLTTYGKTLNQFEIAGKDRLFYPAKANIVNFNQIITSSEKVPEPVAVRYGFSDYTCGTLYNVEGCPVSSFRTDDW